MNVETDRGPFLFRCGRTFFRPRLRGVTHLLPLADEPAPERADAARNREAILAAALRLVETRGVG